MASSLLEQVHGRGNGLKEFVRWKWLVVAIMLAASGHGMILSRGGFCVRGKPGGECLRLPSGRALVSYFSVVCPPLLWSVTDYTPALPAAAARQTLNSLLAVLVYVADEHPAIEAGAGTLKASVVRLYSVIVILSRWVRMGCARLCGVHEAPPRGPGPGVFLAPAGPSLCPTPTLYKRMYHKPTIDKRFMV